MAAVDAQPRRSNDRREARNPPINSQRRSTVGYGVVAAPSTRLGT